MNLQSLSKRQWILVSVSVVIVGVAVWAMQAGYLPEIGKFFAAEPGYVPSCAWYGEPVSPTQQCCSGFVPATPSPVRPVPSYILNAGTTPGVSAEYVSPSPTLIGRPVLSSTPTVTPPYTLTPTPMPVAYCVLPGCQVVQQQVYCIKAPCPAQIQIICPSGITPPPPRPSSTPAGSISVTSPFAGATVAYGTQLPIRWESKGAVAGSPTVVVELVKNDAPGGVFDIASSAPNNGEYIWDTTRVLTGAFGQTIDLKQVSGDAFQIKVAVPSDTPENYVYGLSGTFSIRTGIPTPSSTATPPPPYNKVLLNLGGPTEQILPVTPGTQITIPVNLVTRGTVVTGIDFTGSLGGSAQITGAAIGSAHFPEILRDSVYSNNNHWISFALGSGAGGGWATAEDIATITVTIDKTAQPGSTIEFINTPATEITAAGINTNVFGGGTRARFTVVAPPSKPGDANGDGKVDIFDYNLVVSNFGKTGTNVPGDVNNDGKVDIFDYNLVISNFGK